jgi:ribose transport system substrate-binding protein
VDDLLTKGIAGFAISPVDPANQTQMINDAAQKTIVITHDSDASSSNRLVYIGTDNRAAGRQAGEMIKAVLPSGGKIMLFVGKLDAQNAQERLQGIKDVIAGTNIQIIDVRTDDTDQVRAKANVADTIWYPDVAALVGLWAYNGPAILNAVKEAGKVGKIQIVCFDEDDQTLAGIKDGAIHGTVVQQPYEFGYQAIRIINDILDGNRSNIPESKQKFVPTLVVKKDNVDEFIVKINKLKGGS